MRYILQIIVVYFKVLYFSIERLGNPTPSFIFLQPSNPPRPFFGTPFLFIHFFCIPPLMAQYGEILFLPLITMGGRGTKLCEIIDQS